MSNFPLSKNQQLVNPCHLHVHVYIHIRVSKGTLLLAYFWVNNVSLSLRAHIHYMYVNSEQANMRTYQDYKTVWEVKHFVRDKFQRATTHAYPP